MPRQMSFCLDERVWSKYQEAVFLEIEHGTDNIAVCARAGSGKTTLLCEAINRIPYGLKILVLAFSREIAEELKKRISEGAEVFTTHSLGVRTLRRSYPQGGLETDKLHKILTSKGFYPNKGDGAWRDAVRRVVSRAKATLPTNFAEWCAVVDATRPAYDELVPEDERGRPVSKDRAWEIRGDLANAATKVIKEGLRDPSLYDFDDMLFTPVHKSLTFETYDWVIVDEAQDLSPVQLAMIERLLNPAGGRLLVVGDPKQAIFGFRGADLDAFGKLVARFSCRVLPLPITYRCPRSVVELARKIVPDFEAAPDAIEGKVEDVGGLDIDDLKPGDFVLSRSNAPLVSIAIRCLTKHIPVAIAGRDLVEKIRTILSPLIKKTKNNRDQILTLISELYSSRIKEAVDRDEDAQELIDERDCLFALCTSQPTPEDALRVLDRISKEKPERVVVCSSVHRAKGLERNRVFVLNDTFRAPIIGGNPGKLSQAQILEEENLAYTAYTRAKKTLVIVRGER